MAKSVWRRAMEMDCAGLTTILVRLDGGRKIFVLAKLVFEEIAPHDLLPACVNAVQLEDIPILLFRNGKIFDRGAVKEFSRRSGNYYIHGLGFACPMAPRLFGGVMSSSLMSRWFVPGDHLKVQCPQEDIRANVLRRVTSVRAHSSILPRRPPAQ